MRKRHRSKTTGYERLNQEFNTTTLLSLDTTIDDTYARVVVKESFSESNPFVKRYQQLSTLFKHYLIESLGETLSYTAIAKRFNVSITTVIRYLEKMKLAKPSKLPVVLSIDKI